MGMQHTLGIDGASPLVSWRLLVHKSQAVFCWPCNMPLLLGAFAITRGKLFG
jgi:hypothetical protein